MALSFLIIFFQSWMETISLVEFLQLIPLQWKTRNNLVFLQSHCQSFPRVFFFFISLGFICVIQITRCEFYWICSSPTLVPHAGICQRGNSFTKQHQGYMFSILMLVLDNFILSLSFHNQDNYLPRYRKG